MTRARNLGKLANTNTLSADNVNNFVGIASTQPTTRLTVVGVVSANIITGTDATFNNVVKVGTAITLDATSGIITAVNGFVGNVTGNATGLSGTPDITVRNVTGVAATFTGVLTYDDVTNVDSLGIVTARGGFEIGASGVGGTITAAGSAEFAGIVTATRFKGDGSQLSGVGGDTDITSSLFI